ncbi:hypothetical protein [Serratia marcescens]|uniref:hypothetical protein n=1 Tax=Serratia marcescens TaxID=615 RepID=UPI000E03A216|nr:hypothetical protein [Serratia marcescens]SUJ35838.1 Uncharacterised protein [Serratia marcescens]
MSERGPREGGLQDESAQAAYVIGLDALASLYHRLASEGALPLSWAVQGMLDAVAGQCQLDRQARQRVRSRLTSMRALPGDDEHGTGAIRVASSEGATDEGLLEKHVNNITGEEDMKGDLSRAERRWRRLVLAVLLPLAIIGAVLLYAMSNDGVVRLLQAAMR